MASRNASASTAATADTTGGAQAVLCAARRLFGERGVDAVSMQDIATSAGVCKANVFHHFASKERLYLEVVRACMGAAAAEIPAIMASTAPFEQRFRMLLRARIQESLADEASTRLVMREVINASPERAQLLATQIFSSKIADNIAFFEDARRRGELAAGVDPSVGSMLLGACTMFFFNCRNTVRHMPGVLDLHDPDDFVTAIARTLCTGLAAQPVAVKTGTASIPRPKRRAPVKPQSSRPSREIRP